MGEQTSVSEPIDFEEPEDLEVFRNLEERLYENGQWKGLLRLYHDHASDFANDGVEMRELVERLESIADELDEDAEASRLHLSIGDLYAEVLEERQSAKQAYRASFVNDTSNTRSLEKARAIYRREEKHDLVMKLYELEQEVAESDESVAVILARKAHVQGDYKGNMDVARELVADALAVDPDNLLAKRTREIYESGGTVEAAVDDTVRLAEDAASGGDSEMAARLFLKAGWLEWYREGGSRDRARAIMERAVDCDPDNEKARTFHDRIAELGDDTVLESIGVEPSVVDVEDEADAAEEAADEASEGEVGDEAAEAREVEVEESSVDDVFEHIEPFEGDADKALEVWEEEPGNLSAFAVIRERLLEEGDWEGLTEKLEETVKHLRKQRGESELMGELARVYWKEIGDLERAEYFYKRLKLLDGEHPDVAAFYEDFYAENEEWRRLFSHLKNRAAEAESQERRRAFVERRAELAESKMESPEKAIDVWRNHLRETGDPEAREELKRLYEEYEKWNGLVDFLKEEVRQLEEEGESTIDRRIEILTRMVDLYEDEIGHQVMALNTLERIVELDPDRSEAFDRLRGMLEESGRWNDLVQLLSERAENFLDRGEPDRAAETFIEVAEILEEELNHVSRAVNYLERTLEVDPEREGVRSHLAELYESKRDYDALFELRREEAELYQGAERLERLRDLLELVREKMRDQKRAIPILEEIVELDGDDLEAYEELEEAYRRRESWQSLRDTLIEKAGLLADGRDQLEALTEAAEIQDEHFDDRRSSIEAWERVLEEAASNERAIARLTELYLEGDAYDAVQELYRERGQYDRLFEILDETAAEVGDVATERELYRTMADLAESELEDRDRIIVSLEQLFNVTDRPREVASELAEWYRESGELEREIDMTEVVLEHTEDDERRREVLERLSRLEESREAHGDALSWAIEALELAPERTEALERAEHLAAEAEDFATFVELVEAIAEGVDDESLRTEYFRRIGRLEESELDRPADAIRHLEFVREQQPEDLETLERLADLYDETDSHGKLVEVLSEIVELRERQGGAEAERIDALSRIAGVRWEHLDEPDAALRAYQEILELEPDHLEAIRGVARVRRRDEEWSSLVEHLEHELSLLPVDAIDRRIEVHLELARLYRGRIEDPSEALYHCREVLDEEADHDETLEEARSLLDEPEVAREASLLVAPLLRERGAWEELAEALEARLRVASDDYERLEILDELVSLYRDELRDEDAAFERAVDQFKLDPEREDVVERIEELAATLGRWDEVETLFASEAPAHEEEANEPRRRLLRRVAEIRRTQLDDPEGAARAFRLLYGWMPEDREIAESLESLYRHLERHEDLVVILEDRADRATSDERRIERLEEIATLYDEVLEDAQGAIESYRAIREIDPADDSAVAALESLYRERGDWIELEELYVEELDRIYDPNDRRDSMLDLARLRMEQLEDFSGAQELLSELLDEDPGDDDVVEAAQQLESKLVSRDGDWFDLRLRLAESLEPVYRDRHEPEPLIESLRIQLRAAEDPFDELELLDELSRLHIERIDDAEGGFELLRKAVELDPDDESRREQFEMLGREVGEVEAVAETLEGAAEAVESFEAPSIYRRVAGLYEEELERPQRAIACWERVLDFDENDMEALRALERLFEQTGQRQDLVENLRRQTRLAEPERRAELYERIGTLELRVLDRPERAVDAFESLADLEPDALHALEVLEELYGERDELVDLADVLRRKSEVVTEIEREVETRLRLAKLYEHDLEDRQEAIAVYSRILELDSSCREAMEALERLYETGERWPDLAELLREKLNVLDHDDEERAQVEMKLGDVLRDKLYEPGEAVELYRVVLGRNPNHRDAVEGLEALAEDPSFAARVEDDLVQFYTRQEEWDDLVAFYRDRAEQVGDPEESARYHHELGQVWRDALGDPYEAIDALAEAWRLAPESEIYENELLDLVEQQDAWVRLTEVMRDVVPEVRVPERRAELYMVLATLERERLDQPLEAEEHFRAVLEIDDTHLEAYEELDELLVDAERWHDLVDVLEREYEVLERRDPEEASDLLVRLAYLQEMKVDDPYAAAECFERLLESEPTHSLALEELGRLYREQARWEDLAEHLEQRLERAIDAESVVELNFELAELLRSELYRHEDAVSAYEQILDLDVGHEPTLEALEELFEEEPGLAPEVAPLLERAYRFHEDWERVLDVLEERAAFVEAPEDRVSIWEDAAEIAEERLGRAGRAFEFVGEIFRVEPQREALRNRLGVLAARTERWEELVEMYDDALQESVPSGDPLRPVLFFEQGRLLESHLERLDEARRMYGEALLEDDEFDDAIDALERVLSRQEDWAELANFYRDRARSRGEISAMKDWLEKLARLEEVVRYDVDAAIEAYYDILDVDREDEHARTAVQRLLAYDERWFDLAEMYRDQIERTDSKDERISLTFRLAQIQEGELDDVDDAVRLYCEVLEEKPQHRDTLRALEGLRRDLAIREGEWRDYRLMIIQELRERYRVPEDWRRLVELLEARRELVDGYREKADLLVDQADLIERGAGDDVERMPALSKLAEAYCLCPGDEELWERFETFADDLDVWARVPPVLMEPLRSSDDREHQSSILVALGDVYRDQLDDPESAVLAYQQAADTYGGERALDRLEEILADMELWQPLVEVLERKADAVIEPDERKRLLERLGNLYDEILEQPHEAAQYFEDLLAEDPGELSYADSLESIYERTGQYRELEDLMQSRIELVDSEEERIRVLRRLATLQDEYLEQPEAAIETYRSLHAQTEEDEQVIAALDRLYEQTERWPELLQILRLEREMAERLDEVNEIDYRRGRIQLEHVGDVAEAFESFKSVLERDPHFERAREAMSELAGDPTTGPEASEFLQEIYRNEGDWSSLEELFEEQLDVIDNPERRGEVYMELAQLHEEHRDNPQMAFAMLGRAFRELPELVYIRHELDRISSRLENPRELLAIYEDTLDSELDDPDLYRDLHVRASTIAIDRLDEPERAIEHATSALEYDAFDDETLELLDRLYQQTHRWEDLAETLERRLELADADSLNDVRFRLGYLYEVMFEDFETALDFYREVAVEEPGHRGVIEGLERMLEDRRLRREIADLLENSYRSLEEWERLVEVYELELEVVGEPTEEASLNKQIADLHLDRLDQPEIGYAFLGRALRADPHAGGVQERLEELAHAGDRYEELVALYEELVESTTDPMRLVEFAEKAARWAHHELGELERAADLYRQVTEVEPEHEEALDGLEQIARELGENDVLADALEQKAETLFEPDEQRDVLLELGKVCTDLEEYGRAANAYRQALLLDESDTEVMRQLVGLYEVTEQYEDLVDVLDRLTTYEQEPDALVRLYRQIATYSRHFIEDNDRAVRAYQQVLEFEPGHEDAMAALEELYREQERWTDLRSILQRSFEEAETRGRDSEVARAAIELGRLSHEEFDEVETAIDWFNRALEVESGHPDVIEALEELYRQEQRWDELMDLLDEQFELAETDAKRARLLTEMARVNLKYLDQLEDANELLNRAFEIDPGNHEALRVRADIFRRRENWTGLLDVLDAQLQNAETVEQEVAIRTERGDVYENELDEPSEALRDYLDILEIEPLNRVILERAGRLYEETGNPHGKYSLMEHEVEHVEEEDQEVNLLLDMAEMARERLESPELAVEALERAYELRPDDLDIVEPLIDAYLQAGRTEEAEPILEELISLLEDEGRDDEAARFEHQYGQLAEQRGDLEEAMRRYEAVFKKDDSYIPNLLSQGRLAFRMENWEKAKNTFQKLLLHQMKLESDSQKVEVYHYLGRIRQQLGDDRRARDMFNRALSLDSEHEPTRQALGELED